jgi:hypothetical protein
MNWQALGIGLFAFAIVAEQAHVASPIVLAWTHPGLRRIALSRPIETLLLPGAAIIGMMMLPLWWAWAIYWPWNIYHFGAQHYGVGRILGVSVSKWLAIGMTAGIMGVGGGPFWSTQIHAAWWPWFILFAIDFNHWLVDIGLSARVSRYWWLFVLLVVPFGLVGFLWMVPRADHIATLFVPRIIQARWGVGIAHFLYSRWVWKLSDPQVRALIGPPLELAKV